MLPRGRNRREALSRQWRKATKRRQEIVALVLSENDITTCIMDGSSSRRTLVTNDLETQAVAEKHETPKIDPFLVFFKVCSNFDKSYNPVLTSMDSAMILNALSIGRYGRSG